MPMQVFVHVFVEGDASRQASRALRHRRARCIKNSKRQHIRLTQQVCNRPIHELSRDLLIRKSGGIPRATMQSIRPSFIPRAVRRIGVRYKRRQRIGGTRRRSSLWGDRRRKRTFLRDCASAGGCSSSKLIVSAFGNKGPGPIFIVLGTKQANSRKPTSLIWCN